jgi:hypothetical protein
VRYGQWREGQRVFIIPDGYAREIMPESHYAGVPKPAPIAARNGPKMLAAPELFAAKAE